MSINMQTDENALASGPAIARPEMKSPTAFRTISEVADELKVPQHVLRFWESKFSQIRPMKRGGGRRYYRPEDVYLLKHIQNLLYGQGYTIRGVQKVLKENRGPVLQRISQASAAPMPVADDEMFETVQQPMQAPGKGEALSAEMRRELESILDELKALRLMLKQAGI